MGIIFLGTPHSGSASADLATTLTKVVNTVTLSRAFRRDLIKELKRDARVLRDISKQCIMRLKGLRVVSFYETEATCTGLFSTLVSYSSDFFFACLYILLTFSGLQGCRPSFCDTQYSQRRNYPSQREPSHDLQILRRDVQELYDCKTPRGEHGQ